MSSSKGRLDSRGTTNSDYRWSDFDSEAYFQHYYGEPHADDERLIAHVVAAFQANPGPYADIVDIGTGPNLIPLFCALPYAQRLTVWEYAPSNVGWLRRELDDDAMRPQWQHFWCHVRSAHLAGDHLPDNPIPLLRERCRIEQGSVYELPERRWDAATMFFCAESITGKREEFDAAVRAFARSVRAGGLLVGAFLVRSGGYEVAGRRFPVLKLSAEEIAASFEDNAESLSSTRIGIVETEIRSGYAGFLLLTGRAR